MPSSLSYDPKHEGHPFKVKGITDINLCTFTENYASFKYFFPQNFKRSVNEGVAISCKNIHFVMVDECHKVKADKHLEFWLDFCLFDLWFPW